MVHPDNIPRELTHSVDVCMSVDGVVTKMVDVRGDFSSKEDFDDRESMLTWIRKNATNIRFGVVIGRSDNGTTRRNPFVTMMCERSGKYPPSLRNFKRDDMGTGKCESPFKIHCYMLASKKWRCSIICALHNHDLCAKLQGYPSVSWLNSEEKTCIKDMSLDLVQLNNILATLKRKEPDSISNIRQVYNQRYCNNKASRGDRSEMQQLLKMLDANKYVSWYRTCDDKVMVGDIFWNHPDSIKLFNTFLTVLILNSTYKTNKYRLSLFKMVGVTSIKRTFAVGFAFLECKKEDNFRWALEVCRSLLKKQVEMPKEIVTDCDLALMNAVAKVFPSSDALIYQYHISCNVRSKVKPVVGTKQVATEGGKPVKPEVIVDQIMNAWARITSSSTK